MPGTAPDPKIELHVHLEGTVRPDTLRAIAKRNDYALPDDLESLYRFRDFAHFIEVWILTTNALRTAEDFRQVVTDYAAEAASHGAVYLEAIFSPAERIARGVGWDEIFSGYCDGAQEARELHGVEVRLTPDIYRGATAENAEQVVRYSAKYRDRGVVAVGLGGLEAEYPPEPYEAAFTLAAVARPGISAARGRGRRRRFRPWRARGAWCRPAPARDPLGRGSRARHRARRPRHRPRRLSPLEPPHRRRPTRSRSTRCRSSSPQASAARSRPTTRRCSTPT